jgi:hypothetical protein
VQVWPDGAKYEGQWANGKANGNGTIIITEANLLTWTGMCMRETGRMIKHQEKESISTLMAQNTRDSG